MSAGLASEPVNPAEKRSGHDLRLFARLYESRAHPQDGQPDDLLFLLVVSHDDAPTDIHSRRFPRFPDAEVKDVRLLVVVPVHPFLLVQNSYRFHRRSLHVARRLAKYAVTTNPSCGPSSLL